MSIYIGGSCIGYGDTLINDTTVNELRFLQSARHTPIVEKALEESLRTRTKMIINLDSYGDGSNRGWHTDENLINFTEQIVDFVIERAYAHGVSYATLRTFCRFTLDNEANEIYSPQQYGHYLDVFSNHMADRFEVGAGNFGNHATDYYNYICQDHSPSFKWLDFHMQHGFETVSKINANIPFYHNLAIRYGKKLSCTEANDTGNDIWTSDGYFILHHQLVKAKEIGTKDFCMIFIKQPFDGNHAKRSFILNNGNVNPHWSSFKQIIKDNKPIISIPPSGGDDCMNLVLLQRGSDNNQVQWLQEILEMEYEYPNSGGYDGIFGAITEQQVKDYQEDKGLVVDGKVGKMSTFDLINEAGSHYTPEYWKTKLQIYVSF